MSDPAPESSLLARTLELSNSAWLRLDAEGVIREASQRAEDVLGWPLDALIGSPFHDPRYALAQLDGTPLPADERPIPRLRRLEVPLHGVRLLFRWPGSTLRELSLSASLLPDGGAILMVDDLTEQQGARRALVRSEERLHLALSASGLGLWEVDLVRKQVLCDSGLARMTGYERYSLPTGWAQIKGLIHPEDLGPLRDAMVAHLREEVDLFTARVRVLSQQGHWLTADTRGRVIDRSSDGRARRVVGTLRNVSAEIKAAEDKRLMTENLARLSRMESLSVLAGGVAHDYNNLLMAMLTGVMVAREDLEADHPALESLALVEEAATKAKDLTRQLLAFSGHGDFVVEPLDVHAALQEMEGLFGALVGKGARVDLLLGAEQTRVVADQTQLQQVVMNLVVNAGQAMGGSGRIRVSTEARQVPMALLQEAWSSEQAEPGPHLLIHVIDSGVGMDQATLSRIFDPFFTTRQDGHGLGLAASLGIVQGHRGFLLVESTPDVGTHFTVGLPLAPEEAEDSQHTTEPVETPGGGLRRILVVDDQPLVRRVTSRMLRRLGWEVWEANSGEEALARYAANPNAIAVLLVDMRMPGMSGAELVEAVRQRCPEQPVVLMSGFEPTGQVASLSQLPRTAFLAKPFFQKQLLDRLEEVTQRRS